MEKFADNFVTHSKNFRDIEKSKDPQEWSISLKSLYRSDTAEKPEKANIQGVGLKLVKLKNNNREYIQP